MFYILRHGQTDWNVAHKLQGQTDIPLNEKGKEMALAAGERYRACDFDICYCSPLIRAKETAQLFLKERDIPIVCDDRLKEMSFGVYEGAQDVFVHPEWDIYSLFHQPEEYVNIVEGGESFSDLFDRTRDFLEEVLIPHMKRKDNVLVVGHGAMNACILCQIKGIPITQFWSQKLGNCELVSFSEEMICNRG